MLNYRFIFLFWDSTKNVLVFLLMDIGVFASLRKSASVLSRLVEKHPVN